MENINFNITIKSRLEKTAQMIACQIRESGYEEKNYKGEMVKRKGLLRNVLAKGWTNPQNGEIQVSMIITNYMETPIWLVFETMQKLCLKFQTEIISSEFFGEVTKECYLQTAKYIQMTNSNSPKKELSLEESKKLVEESFLVKK